MMLGPVSNGRSCIKSYLLTKTAWGDRLLALRETAAFEKDTHACDTLLEYIIQILEQAAY